jgi:arabinogalactan endo-1,4-beta-galactosidase
MIQDKIYYLLFIIIISLNRNVEMIAATPFIDDTEFISAIDISSFPEIELSNPVFYRKDGQQDDFISIIKASGINTIRLRLWVNPINRYSGFEQVKEFSRSLRNSGFKIWLTLHYSDTWADPGHQEIPALWQRDSFPALKETVQSYTQMVAEQIRPELIQIGNEINTGFLHPVGNLITNSNQFLELMAIAIQSVRTSSPESKIIIHYAGIYNSEWFFEQLSLLDYDLIGLSFYPIWHGKDLNELKIKMEHLSQIYSKNIVIAETAYPFTLEWNDLTNNIIGLDEQLILPAYPATKEGQRDFIRDIKKVTKEVKRGMGFCYWGAEVIAWKGNQATDASPWENQALFDFENKALPALAEFKCD